MKRIALSGENDYRRYLLTECAEAYSKLDDTERQRMQELMNSDKYKEVRPIMITTFERGKIEGKIEGVRDTVLFLLETKFGPLPEETIQRVHALNPEQVRRLSADLLKAESLNELDVLN